MSLMNLGGYLREVLLKFTVSCFFPELLEAILWP